MSDKGQCKHGEFDLLEGCPDCIQEAGEGADEWLRERREAEDLGEEVQGKEGMTIDEAIEALHEDLGADTYVNHPYLADAIKLGIEGLKAWDESRKAGGVMQGFLLPRETEVEKEVVEECSSENPCCDRRGEYNGFSSGPLLFVCPNHCSCHD